MSRIKNKKFFDIALQVGGSLYPEVGGELLEKFGEEIVKQCIEVCDQGTQTQTTSGGAGQLIKQHFGVK